MMIEFAGQPTSLSSGIAAHALLYLFFPVGIPYCSTRSPSRLGWDCS